jgi:uncharacterized membrane protein YgcG
MARRLLALAIAGAFLAPWLLADRAVADTLPPSQAGVYVYDFAHIWSPATIQSAQATAEAIRARTQAELAIVSWPTGDSSVSTDTAAADARLIMDTWGVGRAGVNDGLVVLFDLDDTLQHGQIYLYAGSGFVDRYLNPDEAAGIVNGTMLPRAKDGDLDAALLDGLARIDHVVQPNGNPDRAGEAAVRDIVSVLVVLVGVAVFGLFFRTWWLRGRDARVPRIDDSVLLPAPPPGLTPALSTVLRKDEVDHDAFTSALVDLGHRGLVTFRQSADSNHHVDLVVPAQGLDDPASVDARRRPLGPAEQALAQEIARKAGGRGSREAVLTWNQLKAGRGKELYDAFKPQIGKAAAADGWFRDDPTKITGRWIAIGVGLVIAAIAFAFLFFLDTSDGPNLVQAGRGWLGIPLGIVVMLGVVVALASRFLAARTPAGAQALAMALAYRNTLRFELNQAPTIDAAVAQTKTRLPWITTPDELTVWAVALGLKDEVDHIIRRTFEAARQSGVAVWSPAWYSGSGAFGSIGDFSSMVSSISTTSVSSSGGGYGGGGGGGGGGAGGGF